MEPQIGLGAISIVAACTGAMPNVGRVSAYARQLTRSHVVVTWICRGADCLQPRACRFVVVSAPDAYAIDRSILGNVGTRVVARSDSRDDP
jgi:hypothetical protein